MEQLFFQFSTSWGLQFMPNSPNFRCSKVSAGAVLWHGRKDNQHLGIEKFEASQYLFDHDTCY